MAMRLMVWLFSLCCALPVLAALDERSAAEKLAVWKNLPEAEQLPTLVDLITYYSKNNTPVALELAPLALNLVKQQPNPALHAQILNDKAYALYMNGHGFDAIEVLVEAQQMADANNLPQLAGRAAMVMGYIYGDVGLYEQALQQHHRALLSFENSEHMQLYSTSLKNIAGLLIEQNQITQGEYYLKQLDLVLDAHPDFSKAPYFELIGHRARMRRDFEQAVSHYQQALAEYQRIDNRIGQHVMCAAIANALNALGQAQQALHYVDRGMILLSETGTDARKVNLLRERAMALMLQGKLQQAKALLLELLTPAQRLNDNVNLAGVYDLLAQTSQKMGDWQSAFHYQREFHDNNARVLNENTSKRTALLDASFQSERKNKEIALLRAENQLQQLALERQQQRLTVAIALSVAVLVTILLLVLRWHYKKELHREQALNSKLIELDQLKDQVLANTSHELRTPLNGIVGLSEVLLQGKLDDLTRQHIALIADSGRRLTDVVNELLDFARLKQNKIVLNPQPLALVDAVTKAVQLASPAATEKQLAVVNRVGGNLPVVHADHDRLQQVLLNLLNNAIKFTRKGHVEIAAEIKSTMIEVSIKDTGIGIPHTMLDRIFEAFYQVDSSSARRHQGAGLGLSITKQLVELWGGEIGVESNTHYGSRFWFTVPVVVSR